MPIISYSAPGVVHLEELFRAPQPISLALSRTMMEMRLIIVKAFRYPLVRVVTSFLCRSNNCSSVLPPLSWELEGSKTTLVRLWVVLHLIKWFTEGMVSFQGPKFPPKVTFSP